MSRTDAELPAGLADILSTLARHAPQPQISPVLPGQAGIGTGTSTYEDEEEYNPADFVNQTIPFESQREIYVAPTVPPPIDPATITDWPNGLRCVSKMASQNPSFPNAIRRMMSNQKKNEMDWYAKRQELKRNQAQRGAGQGELHSILCNHTGAHELLVRIADLTRNSIGVATSTPSDVPVSNEKDNEAELAAFDEKIYRAQLQMNTAITHELKALGVPFFGTRVELIIPASQDGDVPSHPTSTKRISQAEHRDLQRRMINYLEDMYKVTV